MLVDPFSPYILLIRARISSSEQAPPPLRHAPPQLNSAHLYPTQPIQTSSRGRARASSACRVQIEPRTAVYGQVRRCAAVHASSPAPRAAASSPDPLAAVRSRSQGPDPIQPRVKLAYTSQLWRFCRKALQFLGNQPTVPSSSKIITK